MNLARARAAYPGLAAAGLVAIAATFLGVHYSAPVLLFALLLGMSVHFLSQEGPCKPGIDIAARSVLRVGVALLGLRITFGQVSGLGWQPVLMVLVAVASTIGFSILLARLMGFNPLFGLLSGGAVAICGASAAMALSAALPNHPLRERATLFTVVGVSLLSTVTMVAYPLLARALGLDSTAAGIFLGGSIHDVAQVVGAGYAMSQQTGDVATVVKLLRVALLLPVIVGVALYLRVAGQAATGERPAPLPGFALAFGILVAAGSMGWVPDWLARWGSEVSRWCLVAAMAAIGMKTQLRELAAVGWKPVLLMTVETAFLAGLILCFLR